MHLVPRSRRCRSCRSCLDRQRCPPAAPHRCPKTAIFGHGTFRKPHLCPKTAIFGYGTFSKPHLYPKTPCFGHGAFRKPHRCPKTLHFGNKMLAPTIFVSRNGHFGARTPRRTPSDGQGLISGATPCPHFGLPCTSNGQGPHHEIRPCPSECVLRGVCAPK